MNADFYAYRLAYRARKGTFYGSPCWYVETLEGVLDSQHDSEFEATRRADSLNRSQAPGYYEEN